jgi:heme a synthase
MASISKPQQQVGSTAVALWLLSICVLIFVMVIVGGATRLTESGLSIVSWKPISGIVPPLTHGEWLAELEAYRQIPEYQQINKGMSLAAFKEIYWWEYAHRLLGRLIGLAYALPLAFFWFKRMIPGGFHGHLLGILALGGLQGAVGWWMVSSGLVERTDVSHYRLATHLGIALLLFALIQWTALDLLRGRALRSASGLVCATSFVLVFQLIWGAFVAGLDAGYAFNSWPKMGEHWVAPAVWELRPWTLNLVENPAGVQFLHRGGAILLMGLGFWLAIRSWRQPLASVQWDGVVLAMALSLQFLLGIATLIGGVPIILGVAHQGGAVLVIAALVSLAHRLQSHQLPE